MVLQPSIFMAGTLIFIAVILIQNYNLHRRIFRTCRPIANEQTLVMLFKCKQKMGITKEIPVYLSSCILTPFCMVSSIRVSFCWTLNWPRKNYNVFFFMSWPSRTGPRLCSWRNSFPCLAIILPFSAYCLKTNSSRNKWTPQNKKSTWVTIDGNRVQRTKESCTSCQSSRLEFSISQGDLKNAPRLQVNELLTAYV